MPIGTPGTSQNHQNHSGRPLGTRNLPKRRPGARKRPKSIEMTFKFQMIVIETNLPSETYADFSVRPVVYAASCAACGLGSVWRSRGARNSQRYCRQRSAVLLCFNAYVAPTVRSPGFTHDDAKNSSRLASTYTASFRLPIAVCRHLALS